MTASAGPGEGDGATLPDVPPSDRTDPARSDEALRRFADHLLERIRPAYRAQPDTEFVEVTLAIGDRSGDEPVPYLMPAATLDEVARVLGALPQIRGGR